METTEICDAVILAVTSVSFKQKAVGFTGQLWQFSKELCNAQSDDAVFRELGLINTLRAKQRCAPRYPMTSD